MRISLATILLMIIPATGEAQPNNKLMFAGKPLSAEATQHTIRGLEKFFARLREKGAWDTLQVNAIFHHALTLAEVGGDLSNITHALNIAERMQDLDSSSPTYGNFRWYWFNESVGDRNAVEFSMRSAGLLYRLHRDKIPHDARAKLEKIMRTAVKGILNHPVPESYTNIFIMKTWNLISLGELLGMPDVTEEGYRHLDRFVIYTAENGIHEYLSPTYYGTDLESLVLIERYAGRERARRQARALLKLFWTDIAANWFEPARRLGGAHSRDYDYLHGHGILEPFLQHYGWLPPQRLSAGRIIFMSKAAFRPEPALKEMSLQFPRLVRQSWGEFWYNTATNYLTETYCLGTAGANYGPMDKPLTILFADPELVGAYFLMDARRDPYGRTKIPQGRSGHKKALHLRPFLMTVQDKGEALLLAAPEIREMERIESDYLASHLVLPARVEKCIVGGKAINTTEAFSRKVQPDEPIFLAHRGAILGVKVVHAKGIDGGDAEISLVHEKADDEAMRLTVTHYSGEMRTLPADKASVALWVRIAPEDEKFVGNFQSARSVVERDGSVLTVRAEGAEGKLLLKADMERQIRLAATIAGNKPPKHILAVNGVDLGEEIMKDVPPVESYRRAMENAKITVSRGRVSYFEAESSPCIIPPMTVSEDSNASGGRFIWMPGEIGGKGGNRIGRAVFPLRLEKADTYYLWARVLTPTPSDDSFFISVSDSNGVIFPMTDWHTGVHKQWTWVRVTFREKPKDWLKLPRGEVRLEIRVREDGARLDKLFIVASPDAQP